MILSRKGGICISKRPLSHTGHQLNMEQAKGGGWCNIGRNDGGWHKAGGGVDVEK